jgi:hypothetical protein
VNDERSPREQLREWMDVAPPDRVTEPVRPASDSDRFAGYHVREPNGTWRQGGNEGHVWGTGRVLGSGEPPPGPVQGGNTPEQPTLEGRRKAAANAAQRRRDAAQRRRDAECSERTGNDKSQGR